MAKRMATSAEVTKTSSSTRPRRKYRSHLRSMLVRLCVAGMARHEGRYLLHARFVGLVHGPEEGFVFSPWLSDSGAHEVDPDGQGRLGASLFLAQGLLLIVTD